MGVVGADPLFEADIELLALPGGVAWADGRDEDDVGIDAIAEVTGDEGIDDVGIAADGGGLSPLLSKNLLSNSRLNKSAWSAVK